MTSPLKCQNRTTLLPAHLHTMSVWTNWPNQFQGSCTLALRSPTPPQRPCLRRRFCVNVSDSFTSLTILFIFWQKAIISVLIINTGTCFSVSSDDKLVLFLFPGIPTGDPAIVAFYDKRIYKKLRLKELSPSDPLYHGKKQHWNMTK
jgi:hypothetical protein